MTPADVHYERVPAILAVRAQTLDAAFAANPQRFKGTPPPDKVWINPPAAGLADPQEPPEQH